MTWIKGKSFQAVFIMLLVGCAFFIIGIIGNHYLPRYLEFHLIPGIAKDSGIENFFFNIRRIGLSGIDAGPIRIGTSDNPALLIRSIKMDYSPGDLFQKKVHQICLSGITIRCAIKDGAISFPGIDLQNILAGTEKESAPSSAPATDYSILPADQIEIREGTLLLKWEENEYRIPFELEITPEAGHRIKTVAWIFPRNGELSFAGDILYNKNRMTLSISSNSVPLNRFTDIVGLIPGLNLSGDMGIEADAEFRLSPFSIDTVNAVLSWEKMGINYDNFQIGTTGPGTHPEDVFKIHLKGEEGKTWQIDATDFSIVAPAHLLLSDFSANIIMDKEGFSTKGQAKIQIDSFPSGPPAIFAVQTPISTTVKMSAAYDNAEKWNLLVSNVPGSSSKERGHIEAEGMEIFLGKPVFNFSASGESQEGTANWDLAIPDIQVKNTDIFVKIPSFKANGKAVFGENQFSANVRVDLSGTELTSGTTNIIVPNFSCSGGVKKEGTKEQRIVGEFKLSKAGLIDTEASLTVKGIQVDFPFSWPIKPSPKAGHFLMENIQVMDFTLGSAKGTLKQKGFGAIWKGTHDNQLLSGLTVKFSGDVAIDDAAEYKINVLFDIPEHVLEPELDFGELAPEAAGFLLKATLQGKGEINVTPIGTDGFFEASIDDAQLRMEEGGILVEGISGKVLFPNLPDIESAPDQKIGFTKATIGEIILENGDIHYKVESPDSFFIEKGRFGWCNGRIDTRSFRVLSGVEDYDLTLYCAKLELAMIIEQLTTFNADGGGTVNGRIPLAYKKGEISFNNGFLFSEPGVIGRIQITETEMLTEGLMADTPQFAQLDLAQEALKNYEYKWVKLELNSKKEKLFMTLRFDGKPVLPLPFALNKETGQLVRDKSGKMSLFEGIGLDINTSLPLTDILQYKDILTKKMQ